MMFTITLNERVGTGVLALAVHPGVVATELFQHVAWARTFPKLASAFLKVSHSNHYLLTGYLNLYL